MADNENLQAPTHDPAEEPRLSAESSGATKDAPTPERLRVHSLARVLGTTSRRIIDALIELDGRARSAHSTIGREEADRVREVLGLSRPDGRAYEGYQIGKGPVCASWDRLDGNLPEFHRYSLEQLYFPPGFGTILAQVRDATGPTWFGVEKKEMLRRWQSWLTIFIMSEDDNEGVFGPPPETGNADRVSQQMLSRGPLRYDPTANTRAAWARADADVRDILERDGLAKGRFEGAQA